MNNIENIFPSNEFDYVMDCARDNYESALIIGYDKNGCLDVRGGGMISGRQPTMKDWLFMIEAFKLKLMNGDYC